MVSFVILNRFVLLINPYFHTFNRHLQVLTKHKEIQYQCPHSKPFSGFRACYFHCIVNIRDTQDDTPLLQRTTQITIKSGGCLRPPPLPLKYAPRWHRIKAYREINNFMNQHICLRKIKMKANINYTVLNNKYDVNNYIKKREYWMDIWYHKTWERKRESFNFQKREYFCLICSP